MNNTEIAWAAGFFDGEGTTYCRRQKAGPWTLELRIGQAEDLPGRSTALERMQRALGGIGIIYSDTVARQRLNPRSKPFLSLRIARRADVKQAIALMWPYLCDPKRQQILAAQAEEAEHAALPRPARGKYIARGLAECGRCGEDDWAREPATGKRSCRRCNPSRAAIYDKKTARV